MPAFMTARWENIALLTYRVPKELVLPHLAPGCELDLWEGQAHVSLVALDFLNMHVMGVTLPVIGSFPQINLRVYARMGELRGVCFIREYVPRWLIAGAAKTLFNEPFMAADMESHTKATADALHITHRLSLDNEENRLEIAAGTTRLTTDKESPEHFFKQRHWGFSTGHDGKLVKYEVIHPEWEVHPVRNMTLTWDWVKVYGAKWAILGNAQPYHAMLAAGSDVELSPKRLG